MNGRLYSADGSSCGGCLGSAMYKICVAAPFLSLVFYMLGSASWNICIATTIFSLACYLLVTALKYFKKGVGTNQYIKIDVVTIYVTSFVVCIENSLLATLIPYIALDLGARAGMVGLLESSTLATACVVALAYGYIGDKVGRDTLLIIMPVGHVAFHVGSALSSSYTELFVCRFAIGIFGGINPLCETLITECVDEHYRAEALGKLWGVRSVGGVLGPLLASLIAPLGKEIAFYIAACLSFINWMWILWSLAASQKRKYFSEVRAQSDKKVESSQPGYEVVGRTLPGNTENVVERTFPDNTENVVGRTSLGNTEIQFPGMLLFWCLVATITIHTWSMCTSMLPLYYKDAYTIAGRQMGLMNSLAAVAVAIGQGVGSGFVNQYFGSIGSNMVGNLGVACVCSLVLLFHARVLPWIVTVAVSTTSIFTNPHSCAAVASLANDQNRGAVIGIYQASRLFGEALGPGVGGVLYSLSAHALFGFVITTSSLVAITCAAVLLLQRNSLSFSEGK